MSRAFNIINLLLGALIVIALAVVSSEQLGHRLSTLSGRPAEQKSAPSAVTGTTDLAGYSPVLTAGLFGKATQGQLSAIVNTPSSSRSVTPATAPAELQLLGTVVGSFRETFALIRNTAKQEEQVFRLGDMVFGAGRLAEVGRETAFIMISGKKVQLLTPTAPPAPASTPALVAGKPDSSAQVANLGGGNFVIDQRALENALDNPAQIMTAARLLPSQKDGRIEGFRASEVKPTGLFSMIGIRNGDILTRLNDFPIDAPDKALQSLIALKGQSRLKLDIIRDGQPQTMNYDIR